MITQNLLCSTQFGISAIQFLRASVEPDSRGALRLIYILTGHIGQLLIPEPKPAGQADGLWPHTCFEAFIEVEGQSRYHEYNFSPSGEWSAYAFDAYRQRGQWTCSRAPDITVTRSPTELVLEASIAWVDLPDNQTGRAYRLGLTAVIEDRQGGLSYWALIHPAERPDFHLSSGFICRLVSERFF
ncbi:MAG: DOMON-like domain-containing protein [Pseudomonadota bacterium]